MISAKSAKLSLAGVKINGVGLLARKGKWSYWSIILTENKAKKTHAGEIWVGGSVSEGGERFACDDGVCGEREKGFRSRGYLKGG